LPLNAIQSMELITGAPDAEFGDKTSLVVNAVTQSGRGKDKPFGSIALQYGSFGTPAEEASLGWGNSRYGNFVVANTLLAINTFLRQDQVNYYPSGNPFADNPATLSQARRLSNFCLKADISYVHRHHNVKVGVQTMQTRLKENFTLGLTDPLFNAVCVDGDGNPLALPGIRNPDACASRGYRPNPDLQPGLIPFDRTRGGSRFAFSGSANVNEFAYYVQDSIVVGNLTLNSGLRLDRYSGLSKTTGVQPRFGISYLIKGTGSVLRAAYSRTMETPYNENLVISSATGSGGLATNVFGAYASQPLRPGRRNQFNVGLQQSLGRFLMVDGDYFWKFTGNAFDFDTLFNTPIHFPISWRKSKIDGVSLRLSTPDIHGFVAATTMGHTRARFFGPEVGGLIFNSPVDQSVFRIDHDQAVQQTTNLRYQRPKNGPWVSFVWRYDSGLVAGAVTSLDDALILTAAQQAAIGFYCSGQSASLGNPITWCGNPNYWATRLQIPVAGTANPDRNPPRIAPRHLFDISVGDDHLLRLYSDRARLGGKISVINLTNEAALYNFLSTFSGTHFVTPRTVQAEIRISF